MDEPRVVAVTNEVRLRWLHGPPKKLLQRLKRSNPVSWGENIFYSSA